MAGRAVLPAGRTLCLLACLGLLWLCGCVRQAELPVRVGLSVWPGHECLFLARTLNLFDDKQIKLVEYPSTPEVIRAFRNGALEAGAFTADEYLRLREEEPDLRAILVMNISNGADALLARPELQDLRDLKGKRVAVEANALGVYFLARALDKADLDRTDLQLVPLSNDRHIEVYQSGEVDAVVTFEPHRGRLIREGARVLLHSGDLPGEIMDVLVVHKRLIENRGEVLRELLAAWFAARSFLLEQPAKAAALISPRLASTEEEFLGMLSLIDFPGVEANRELLNGEGTQLREQLRRIEQTMGRHGILDGPAPDGAELFNGGLLP